MKNISKIAAISVSEKKGTRKKNVVSAELKENWGIVGDAHAGPGLRQVSLLSLEAIERFQKSGAKVQPGDFAENITTQGMDLEKVKVGDRLMIGEGIFLEISQIGKECHDTCEIFREVGNCIMPTQGLFARVITSGIIRTGDGIKSASS